MIVKIRLKKKKELLVFSHNQQTILILEVNAIVFGHSLNLFPPTNCYSHLPEKLPGFFLPLSLFSFFKKKGKTKKQQQKLLSGLSCAFHPTYSHKYFQHRIV